MGILAKKTVVLPGVLKVSNRLAWERFGVLALLVSFAALARARPSTSMPPLEMTQIPAPIPPAPGPDLPR
jgi:hypothetical protein